MYFSTRCIDKGSPMIATFMSEFGLLHLQIFSNKMWSLRGTEVA